MIASGFFTETTQTGRAIAYTDFQVWPAPASAAPQAPVNPNPPLVTAETPPANDTPSSPDSGAPEFSAEDLATFATILAAQSQVVPLAGPYTANLTEEQGRISLAWADVELADFHARAVFAVPDAASDVPWDIGFMFRSSPDGTLRVAIDSLGNWYLSRGTGAPAVTGRLAGVVTEGDGSNTIELLVAQERAALAVNGNLGALIELGAGSGAGDVAVGAAFYDDRTVADRITLFREFVVLPFDPDAIAATSNVTMAGLEAEAFKEYATESSDVAPLVGPFAGSLIEDTPGTVPVAQSGVSLADFGAVISFVNPDDIATMPWDAGFQFRGEADTTFRIVVGSTGEVYAIPPDEPALIVGTAAAFDLAPGSVNQLQLFVRGDVALFGVNGEYVAAIELLAPPVVSDVQIGTAFFNEDFVQDRATGYEGFSVWQMR